LEKLEKNGFTTNHRVRKSNSIILTSKFNNRNSNLKTKEIQIKYVSLTGDKLICGPRAKEVPPPGVKKPRYHRVKIWHKVTSL